jgi:arylsulfatase A-like enzyme
LLETLKTQGLLDDTLVIITSDHGESFGVHGVFGHGGSLFLDEIAVPLVLLAPGANACVVSDPVSLRDLPATVVDELGLSDGSPFPGHPLSGLWRSTSRQPPVDVSPAFSEIAHPVAFERQNESNLSRRGVQMSLVASNQHYIRYGTGDEQLYNLRFDPYETNELLRSAEGGRIAAEFRRELSKLLNDNRGSTAVETAYLTAYRQWLESLVAKDGAQGSPAPKR